MTPILYESDEVLFTSNGLGRLRDCIRFEVTEERNGLYEIEFDYPVDGIHYNDILMGRVVVCDHDETGNLQPFDIYGCSRPIDGVVTFRGCHISYRQKGLVATGTSINNIFDAITLLKSAKPNNPFNYDFYFPNIYGTGYMSSADGTPKTVRDYLGGVEGSVLDTWGGEYEWDKFNVYLRKERGKDKDIAIRYGVNMTSYEDEIDCSEAYTAVVPYWSGGDNEIVIGDMVTAGVTSYNGRDVCAPLDVSSKFETKPTKAQVETMGASVLAESKPYLPVRNIKVDFKRITESNEYHDFANLQKCALCDSVKVIFPMYGVEASFKIVKVVWDVLQERYKEMELGNLPTTLSEALGIK